MCSLLNLHVQAKIVFGLVFKCGYSFYEYPLPGHLICLIQLYHNILPSYHLLLFHELFLFVNPFHPFPIPSSPLSRPVYSLPLPLVPLFFCLYRVPSIPFPFCLPLHAFRLPSPPSPSQYPVTVTVSPPFLPPVIFQPFKSLICPLYPQSGHVGISQNFPHRIVLYIWALNQMYTFLPD